MRHVQRQPRSLTNQIPSWPATSRLLATAFAALALAACEGETGPAGAKGATGDAGSGCTVVDNKDGSFLVTCGSTSVTVKDGQKGTDGKAGEACSATDNKDGTYTVKCGTDSVTLKDGQKGTDGAKGDTGAAGTSCSAVDNKNGTYTITCGSNTVTLKDGAAGTKGEPGDGYVALQAGGVVGLVSDGGKKPVTKGSIYFVPAADVAAMGATTVAVDSKTDEPLEDLIAQNGANYLKAPIGANGLYSLANLPEGKWFVTYVPDASDKAHLPGGDMCRDAMDTKVLKGGRFDLRVSDAIPADATYVGSGKCVTCHGKSHISQTMHRLGIWSPYDHGALQDDSLRKADLYLALDTKFTPSGTKVWFYGYDGTKGMDKYKTSETEQAGASFSVTVRKKGAEYQFVIDNLKDKNDPNSGVVLRVDSVYGGGVYKQRYMTKVSLAGGDQLMILPLQFNQTGKEDAIYPGSSKTWRDYNSFKWYDEATGKIIPPAGQSPKNSFEKNCMSCHASSATITGSDTTAWKAKVVSDPLYGDFDYNGDNVRDEMNVGCETCHGPGSAHWEAAGQGRFIVAPERLTPERETMICGQCHSRPKGASGTDSPVNAAGKMIVAGTSRNEFLTNYAKTQLDGAASDYWSDAKKHSKSHHQQYSDFIRSKLYKNNSTLMTCSDCHNPHKYTNKNQLRFDANDNTAACGSCHTDTAKNVVAHIDAKLGAGGAMMANATCVDCHMPKTAKSGGGAPGIKIGAVQHWTGDISSHLFDMPKKAESKADGTGMPTAYTAACGTCHNKI